MGFKFKCESCEYDWTIVHMGSYKPAMITAHPCPKCDKKTVVAEPLEVEKIDTGNSSASIIRSEPSMRPSGDFINHLQNIKKSHPGNTMDDKWT